MEDGSSDTGQLRMSPERKNAFLAASTPNHPHLPGECLPPVLHQARAYHQSSGHRSELVEAGLSNRAMARELITRKITTRRGGAWSAKSVSRLRARLDATA